MVAPLAVLLTASAVEAAETAAPAQQERFDVWEFRVLGSSVLPRADIERTLYPFLGPQRAITELEAARVALEKSFHAAGYGTVFVDIPEQDVADGIVRLQVTEGQLKRVRVTGVNYFSGREIRAALPAAKPDTVPHLPTLQGEIERLNRQTPDRVIAPVLKAGATPGTMDIELKVDDKLPLHVSQELNDQYTADTSELRSATALSYDNLFGRLDSLSLQYQTSPEEPSEVSVWAGSYTRRLTDDGLKLAFFYVDSDSDVATVGEGGTTIPVLGRGEIMGARLVMPLAASAAATHTAIGGIEYKDFKESVHGEDLLETPVTYVNLSVGHVSAWRAPSIQWLLSSSAHIGVRSVANESDEFAVKRFHGKPNYFLLRADGGFSYELPLGITARWRAAGQYAVDPVISNEQFSGAGADGVRGYLEAEVLADIGVKSSFELGPSWSLFADRLRANVYGFFDYARLGRLDPLFEVVDTRTGERGELLERSGVTLRSYGVGLGLAAFDHFEASLIWAYPLVDRPSITIDSDPTKGTLRGDSRLHFSIRASW
jgi:hemolysin activation/secretion protein